MQLFIGGACSGRRALVAERFPDAVWYRLVSGEESEGWRNSLGSTHSLIVTGWADWLDSAIGEVADDEVIRARWRELLSALGRAETDEAMTVVLILDEMGRGIIPMAPAQRRLRDLNGWLVQDSVAVCEAVWYVRHGLMQRLEGSG
ncbi:bifunctional adenosylcobinamide kinase/adenosylcobinamide-phosphate guanylyltransferase [Aidingimonas halophila]|uniref:Adenosylcobinamide kinase /adenosylcobinamide-phosphate guanylyltransferase n=1 Tax=Aidingimonas halophila TaxID=574349 RepID=A0A1H2XHK0_9GAMM|nr:bifunctional adenosylcobinamide kinase/adenosylcobinamide-phosphate guanylyltransferase [Aidingimonas halophila]GHC28745.1 hypothetical protein GCM10008094_20850 [Aidingimonas halophila]SDW92305.1 adenosylcobinamide kinase /adenosylcobinamide-phosphate guanylyltransferase [Aidingimonas halophila]